MKVIDYLPLMEPSPLEKILFGLSEEERLRRELAKKNYLNIHQKRRKK